MSHLLRPAAADEVPLFSEEEMKEVAGLMKSGKSPGPDGVPSEVLKVIRLNMYNSCLREGNFPKR